MKFMVANNEASIFERVLDRNGSRLSPAFAADILTWNFDPADHVRMEELATKSTAGTMSESERLEAEDYCVVGDLLAILQAKAHLALQQAKLASAGAGDVTRS